MSANGMSPSFEIALPPELLEQVAQRVAAILRAEQAPTGGGLVDAATLAAELGVSRDTIYAHAAELGGVQIGDGPRPRWRFNLADAIAAWQPPSAPPTRAPRRRRSANSRPGLLPVHGENGHHNDPGRLP
jgi:hypothetical protein